MEEKRKLSGKEKFAYGIGAVGKDMVYMLSASYILYYFQDIMGVNAIAMGIILLIARVFDAFNDPIMGVLVAKTKSRWGKFRPWLFIGTVTNAIVLFIMFAAPPTLDGKGLVAYAAVTYILWGITYTMMDIPYWSMVPAFTEGGKERESLSALARTCAGVGSAIITVITVMVVAALGNMAAAKSDANTVQAFNSDKVAYEAYVLEKNSEGITTGNSIVLSEAEDFAATVDFSAPDKVLNEKMLLSNSNVKFTATVKGLELTNDNAELDFAIDAKDSDKAIIAFTVDEATYASISESTEANTIAASFNSTVEVERLGFKYFSLIIAIIFILFTTITCVCIKEKSTVDVQTASVGAMFKALVQNDQAMAMVLTIVLVNSATYITSNLLIYFFKYDLSGANWQGNYTIFNTFAGGIQILAMMLLFPLLRKFFNTMKIFAICMCSAVFGYIVLLVMALGGTGSVYPYLVPGFFIMAAVGILNVIVTVFLANTVDYGELKNNRRDESVIFSMQTFVVKLASGIAALVASICLDVFSISKQDDTIAGSVVDYLGQSIAKIRANDLVETINSSSVVGLRLTMTLAPIFVLLLAFFIFKKKYILTDAKLEEISTELKARKAE